MKRDRWFREALDDEICFQFLEIASGSECSIADLENEEFIHLGCLRTKTVEAAE
jgi:hypothetical protein